MKISIALFLFVFTGFPLLGAESNHVNCHEILEGEELGGKFETTVKFGSINPTLNYKLEMTLSGQSPKVTNTTYLSPTSACGIAVEFAKDCKVNEKIGNFGYSFTFTCGSEISLGELYCDENCFSGKSVATFKCKGPKVDKKLSGGGLVFHGCQWSAEE